MNLATKVTITCYLMLFKLATKLAKLICYYYSVSLYANVSSLNVSIKADAILHICKVP